MNTYSRIGGPQPGGCAEEVSLNGRGVRGQPTTSHLVGREGNALDKPLGHADEGRLRPREEPVDGGAVDEGGEVAAADPKSISHGGHAEDNVEVLPHAGDEGGEAGVAGFRDTELFANGDHVGRDFILFGSGRLECIVSYGNARRVVMK